LSASPQRLLSQTGAIAIIVGIVIGAGIFKTPAIVAGLTQDLGWTLLLWLGGALLSIAGALCYAELASAFPHAGGDYHFLRKAFGRHIAFLYGWAKATVINTGSIALLAFVFGDYMSQVIHLGNYSSVIWAIAIVLSLTLINLSGIQSSARTQTVLTTLEVSGLIAIVLAALYLLSQGQTSGLTQAPWFEKDVPLGLLGLGMVFVLLTFGGWNESAYISAELKGGPRMTVRVITISLIIITLIYLCVNLALISGLGLDGLAKSKAAPAQLLEQVLGPWGQKLLGIFVAIAALTSINATMIVGARSNYAMGADWPSLSFLSHWQPAKGSPKTAYQIQAGFALALIGFGALQHDGFEAMVEFTAPVFWSFLALVGLAVFRLRLEKVERPFRVPLYPITPLLFCGSCAYLSYSSFSYAASKQAVGISLGVMAAGILAMLALRLHEYWRSKPAS